MPAERICPFHSTDDAGTGVAGDAAENTDALPYVVLDARGTVLEAGPGAAVADGSPVGRNVHTDLAGEAGSAIDASLLSAALAQPGRVVEGAGSWPAAQAGGARREVHWSIVGQVGADEAVRLVAMGTGVPFSEDARHAPHESRAHLRAVLDAAVDGIVTIDEAGTVLAVNRATETIFGHTAAQMLGRNVKMLMPDRFADEHDNYLGTYVETGHRRIIGIGREVEGLRADGSTFPLDLSVSEVRAGGVRHFTGLLRDISERREAETAERRRLDELAHAARLSAMGEMTSGIAHELNQPLAAMVTFARATVHMLEAGTLKDDTLRTSLENIANQGLRAGGIVSRLRRLARKETGQYEPVDLNAVVTDVLALVDHELRLGRTTLRCTLADDLPHVQADRIQIEQVVLNLARNAVDAMNESEHGGRRLDVETRGVDDAVEVSVRDTGPGIEEDALAHVFDSFFTTKAAGIGLGLSISRSIMDAHDGRIRAENMPDGGARFTLTIPVGNPEVEPG